MSELDIYEKIKLITDKESLKKGNIINVGNYEILAKPEYINMGSKNSISHYKTVFRKKDKPQFCYIEFKIERGKPENSIELYIDEFSCSYAEKTKGEGLKMLVALANYIHNKAEEQGVQSSAIELTALPIGQRHGHSNDLTELVYYYQSIGFNMVNITEEELFSNISDYEEDGVLMRANFNEFLEMHRSLLTGGKKNKNIYYMKYSKKKRITKKGTKKRNRTRKYKKGGMERVYQTYPNTSGVPRLQQGEAVAYATPINIPIARATVSPVMAEPMPNSSWFDVAEPPVARAINTRLEKVYADIDLHGMPPGEPDIAVLLNRNPDFNLSYTDRSGLTLLDKAINLSSMKAFNQIINMPNIELDTMMHSLNYLNETIAKLPKNRTRPQMKELLITKMREKGFDI
jgi:hypothetical protein